MKVLLALSSQTFVLYCCIHRYLSFGPVVGIYSHQKSKRSAINIEDSSKMQIIDEVWEGKRSLAETFWLWHVLFANIFVARILSSILPFVIAFPLVCVVTVWIVVGLWRCASNNPGYWAILVKIIIVIGLIDLFFNVFGISLHTY